MRRAAWHAVCLRHHSMAKRAEDLECWQLANQLRTEVIAICAQEQVARLFRFCEGFTEAAGSTCHNIREGFVRFSSRAIIQFFTYALSSLEEVEDYLVECRPKQFIDETRYAADLELAEHARAKTLKFMRYHQEKLRRAARRPRKRTDGSS